MIITRAMSTQQTAITGVLRRITAGQEIKAGLCRGPGDKGLRSVSAVFAALAPSGAEDAKSKMGLASLLKMMWADEYIDEKDARFINDRVHANIQKDGT